MKFTFEQLKKFLGERERLISELLLSLAICCPSLSPKEIFSMFKITLDNYNSQSDFIEDSFSYIVHNWKKNPSMRANRHSTYIFKNLYVIINETEEWDKQIANSTLLKLFEKECRIIRMKLKGNYRDTTLQDKYEIVCEFIELIDAKKKSYNRN